MNIVATGLLFTFIHLFTKRKADFTMKDFLLGGFVGTVAFTAAMMVMNYFYALPLYLHFMNFSLDMMNVTKAHYIFGGVLPFNLIQGVILIAASLVVLVPMKKFIIRENVKFQNHTRKMTTKEFLN